MKITIEKNRSPKEFDIAFSSINDEGHFGNLNQYIMLELGYNESSLPTSRSLLPGFTLIELPKRTPIVFIVTVSKDKTQVNLTKNLTKAFRQLEKNFIGKRLWIPLMGTGAGGLEEEESFDITVKALLAIHKDLAPAEVVISVSSHFDESLIEKLRARLPKSMSEREITPPIEVPKRTTSRKKAVKGGSLADKPIQQKIQKEKEPEEPTPIVAPIDEPTENNTIRSTSISNDGWDKDSLDFDKEAQSLAALVALKELKPPLAIALFGTWGSGKSFFMKQIEKRVRELSIYQGFIVSGNETEDNRKNSDEMLFHSGIAHITLNAWSYLDANLWAGLTHSLFEKLNEYITNNTKGSIEKFKVQVKITKRMEVMHNDLNHFKEKKSQLISLKEKLEKERDSKILRHFQLNEYDDSVKQFLKDVGLQEDEIKLLTPSNIEKLIKSGVSFITYLKANSHSVLIKLIGFTLLFLIVKFGLQEWANVYYSTSNFAKAMNSISLGILAPIIPVLAPVVRFFYSKKTTIDRIEKYIKDISTDNTDVPESAALAQLRSDLKEVDELILEIETSIDEEYSKTSDITQLAITNFISSKNEQEAYQKHLGIITTIRKDFETLSELFSDLNKPEMPLPSVREKEHRESIETDKAVITESFHTNKKLERIILYIDDLDRCSDDKVMEVLEAVHLLMAFPLFIVIVGVDERSVHNALINRQLDRYRGIEHSVINNHFHKIAPREYLEKIFQIPFHLPVPEASGILKLIDDLIPVVGPAVVYKTPENKETTPADPKPNQSQAKVDSQPKNLASEPEAMYNITSKSSDEKTVKPAEDSKPAEQEVVTVVPENVLITADEKEYLQLLSCLVGTNPRSIKRYINIYRIVKTHDNSNVSSKEQMVTLLFLTALFTGKFKETAFMLFQDTRESLGISELATVFSSAKELASQFSILTQDSVLKQILEEPIGNMKKDSEFIQRFSYRIGTP